MWSRQTKTTTFGLSISRPLSHIWPDHYWRLRSQRHFHNWTFSQTTQIDQRPRCTIDGLLLRQPYQDQRIYRLPLHLQVLNGWGLRSSIKQFVSFFCVLLTLHYDYMCSEMNFTSEKSFSSNYKNSQLLLYTAAAVFWVSKIWILVVGWKWPFFCKICFRTHIIIIFCQTQTQN